ncbi:hypothetical protein YTPLAS18_23530 [Nitrospira sp.]|nr:hypothetical protein YTPLAS18_23530 [Nitrospira sp.]
MRRPLKRQTGSAFERGTHVAEIKLEDGIIRIAELDIQDMKAAAILQEYPPSRWAEITRRAVKIGLGYLKGGAES